MNSFRIFALLLPAWDLTSASLNAKNAQVLRAPTVNKVASVASKGQGELHPNKPDAQEMTPVCQGSSLLDLGQLGDLTSAGYQGELTETWCHWGLEDLWQGRSAPPAHQILISNPTKSLTCDTNMSSGSSEANKRQRLGNWSLSVWSSAHPTPQSTFENHWLQDSAYEPAKNWVDPDACFKLDEAGSSHFFHELPEAMSMDAIWEAVDSYDNAHQSGEKQTPAVEQASSSELLHQLGAPKTLRAVGLRGDDFRASELDFSNAVGLPYWNSCRTSSQSTGASVSEGLLHGHHLVFPPAYYMGSTDISGVLAPRQICHPSPSSGLAQNYIKTQEGDEQWGTSKSIPAGTGHSTERQYTERSGGFGGSLGAICISGEIECQKEGDLLQTQEISIAKAVARKSALVASRRHSSAQQTCAPTSSLQVLVTRNKERYGTHDSSFGEEFVDREFPEPHRYIARHALSHLNTLKSDIANALGQGESPFCWSLFILASQEARGDTRQEAESGKWDNQAFLAYLVELSATDKARKFCIQEESVINVILGLDWDGRIKSEVQEYYVSDRQKLKHRSYLYNKILVMEDLMQPLKGLKWLYTHKNTQNLIESYFEEKGLHYRKNSEKCSFLRWMDILLRNVMAYLKAINLTIIKDDDIMDTKKINKQQLETCEICVELWSVILRDEKIASMSEDSKILGNLQREVRKVEKIRTTLGGAMNSRQIAGLTWKIVNFVLERKRTSLYDQIRSQRGFIHEFKTFYERLLQNTIKIIAEHTEV